jgi:predicted kinase
VRPLLVVVCGAPATGKTTLAQRLAADLALPILTKDDMKERLADALGAGDRARSRELGGAAYTLLFAITGRLIDAGVGLVLEANFYRDRAETPLRDLAARCRATVVLCQTDAATRRARFARRGASGDRHAVHLDAEILASEWSDDDSAFAIDIGAPQLIVDTSAGYTPDLDEIRTFVRR